MLTAHGGGIYERVGTTINPSLVIPGQPTVTRSIGEFRTPTKFTDFRICKAITEMICDSLHRPNFLAPGTRWRGVTDSAPQLTLRFG
ncbi:hypothetical protein GCM10010252_44620 [Streptomyces aureoverticillatus]|nr:hypothetical protein GCM10010252_44620 [Streptomyces aureoverticillatus]